MDSTISLTEGPGKQIRMCISGNGAIIRSCINHLRFEEGLLWPRSSLPVTTGIACVPSLFAVLNMFGSIWKSITGNDRIHVSFCVTGIVGCLMLYGVLQERIMASPFPPDDEMFKDSLFLVLCNRLVTTLVSLAALLIFSLDLKPVAPIYSYFAVSFSNVIATTCQYEALKFVSFPVQTLGKCAKMIPVMIWGAVMSRKRYNWKDYMVAIFVTGGCTLFVLTGDIKSKHSGDGKDTNLKGLLLMLTYLAFDGFTSNFQDILFKGYQMTMFNQAFYVQLTATAQSLFGLVTSGTLWTALHFLETHPTAIWSILGLSLAATIGQLFIYHTIKAYGALLFATVMTTRQFLSILLSCILFAHPLTSYQWLGTIVVFGTLYYKAFGRKQESKDANSHTNPKDALEASNDEKVSIVQANNAYENKNVFEAGQSK